MKRVFGFNHLSERGDEFVISPNELENVCNHVKKYVVFRSP